MRLTVTLYDAEGADRAVGLDEVDVAKLEDKDLLWIDAVAPDENTLNRLQELLSVPSTALIGTPAGDRPTLENHGSYFRFSVDAAPGQGSADEDRNAEAALV